MEKMKMKMLSIEDMLAIEGGDTCESLPLACGAGVAISIFTGGIGALIFGPSTVGVCAGAAVACNKK